MYRIARSSGASQMLIKGHLRLSASPSVLNGRRALATSSSRQTAAEHWQQLVGGRAGITRAKENYKNKYFEMLERKAKDEGKSVDELIQSAAAAAKPAVRAQPEPSNGSASKGAESRTSPIEAGSEATRTHGEDPLQTVTRPLPSAADPAPKAKATGQTDFKRPDHPIKPLSEILDLEKASSLPSSAVSQLWVQYHQTKKGFLSAAVPLETYNMMLENAARYPMFVVPLAREDTAAVEQTSAEIAAEATSAVEMHFLEWAILPQPPGVTDNVPPPSTVLFTPLAEYKTRAAYAQPYLILTHWTDLASSHGLVLMRGEISDNVALSETDAQLLAVRLQLFYNASTGARVETIDIPPAQAALAAKESQEQPSTTTSTPVAPSAKEQERARMLESFHADPANFDTERLVQMAWELH